MVVDRRSVRFRVTALAGAMTVVVLVFASFGLVALQRAGLIDGIDATLVQRGDEVEAALELGPPDSPPRTTEAFTQVVSTNGTVLMSSTNLEGVAPLPFEVTGGDAFVTTAVPDVDDDTFRVLSRPIAQGVLHVGTTADPVTEATATLATALGIMVPLLVTALVVLVWWLVGQTLAPVEEIRSEVSEIGATDLTRRVPEPGTGDEIDELARTMNGMLGRLEAGVAARERFVADASHELRTPLARLRSALELAAAGGADPTEVAALLEDTTDMQALVEGMLLLARSDDPGDRGPVQTVDLDEVVLAEASLARRPGGPKVDTDGVSGVQVLGRPDQLNRLVRNLLDNAVRHAASSVSVVLAEADGQALLTVSDDGQGVAPEDADRVFERFTNLGGGRPEEGIGLGLAIARDIAERHGGSLDLDVALGPGASFELRLPTAR